MIAFSPPISCMYGYTVTFMLDLIVFFDCVYVRRWDWWLFVIMHRKWIRRAVVELRVNEVQFLMLCLRWIWMLSLWFVSFAFVCLLKIWLSFFFLFEIMFFCKNVSYRCAIDELRKNDSQIRSFEVFCFYISDEFCKCWENR